MRYLFPLAGLVLVACGIRVYRRMGTRAALWYLLSFPPACVFLTLWPPQNAIAFDHLTRLPGLSRLVSDSAAALTAILQFAFALSLGGAMRARHHALIGVYPVLVLALASCWLMALHTIGPDLARLAYNGFDGRPVPMLIWNTISGATTGFADTLGLLGYYHVVRVVADRPTRLFAALALAVFGAALTYSLLVIVQAWASHAGAEATALTNIMRPLVVVGVLVGVAITLTIVVIVPLWHHLRLLCSLHYQQARIVRLRRDITDAIVVLTDRLVLLSPYADPAVLQLVDRRCAERRIPSEQRKVVIEAGRWIALHKASASVSQGEDLAAPPQDEDVVAEMLRKADRENYFYADVYRVVALTLGSNRLPPYTTMPEGKVWHRQLANILREALDARGQQLEPPQAKPLLEGAGTGTTY